MRNAKTPGTTIRLAAAAFGVIALLGAATAAGVSRGEEMNANGAFTGQPSPSAITGQSHIQTSDLQDRISVVRRL